MKILFVSTILSVCLLNVCNINAHSHHTTYIVEAPVTTVVAVPIPPPAPSMELVETVPPEEVNEEMGVSPGGNYAWVKGHWQWNGHKWERVHGHWVVKPSASAVWVGGYWEKHDHHWKWKEGYWK